MNVGRLLCVVLVAGACVACQERVVRDDTMWSGDLASEPPARLGPADPTTTQEDEEAGGFFSDAGELLFGWTRALTGQEKPREPSRAQQALKQANEVSGANWAELWDEQSE